MKVKKEELKVTTSKSKVMWQSLDSTDVSPEAIDAVYKEFDDTLLHIDMVFDKVRTRVSDARLTYIVTKGEHSTDYSEAKSMIDNKTEAIQLKLKQEKAKAEKKLHAIDIKKAIAEKVLEIKIGKTAQLFAIKTLKEQVTMDKLEEVEVNNELPRKEEFYQNQLFDKYDGTEPKRTLWDNGIFYAIILTAFCIVEGIFTFLSIDGLAQHGLSRWLIILITLFLTAGMAYSTHEIGAFIKNKTIKNYDD